MDSILGRINAHSQQQQQSEDQQDDRPIEQKKKKFVKKAAPDTANGSKKISSSATKLKQQPVAVQKAVKRQRLAQEEEEVDNEMNIAQEAAEDDIEDVEDAEEAEEDEAEEEAEEDEEDDGVGATSNLVSSMAALVEAFPRINNKQADAIRKCYEYTKMIDQRTRASLLADVLENTPDLTNGKRKLIEKMSAIELHRQKKLLTRSDDQPLQQQQPLATKRNADTSSVSRPKGKKSGKSEAAVPDQRAAVLAMLNSFHNEGNTEGFFDKLSGVA